MIESGSEKMWKKSIPRPCNGEGLIMSWDHIYHHRPQRKSTREVN